MRFISFTSASLSALTGLILVGVTYAPAASAQAFEKDWMFSANVARTSIDRETSGTPWHAVTDQSKTSFIGSLSWFATPNLSIRASYEFGAEMRSSNRCPPDTACTLIAVHEQGDMESLQLVLVPEFDLTDTTFVFANLGIARTTVDTQQQLPRYSSTDFIYGAGVGYRLSRNWRASLEYVTSGDDYQSVRLGLALRF
ncbi:MAG: porin family protein [Aliidiomarina sp.]|uniref:outer membrane beta-barrel protein n=1 Tax=Aliidiomarina sp. TaxID=1872439 RepID=UPI0025BCCD1B|nr:outer membrane beta-barrel protein [Aliidiomarina sp.]MCH8502124.1 porin family protein [Aliidiomarina sp.]